MRRRALHAVVVLTATLALVGAGCGGDDSSSSAAPADEWADDFCTAVSDWTDELRRIGDEIQDPSSLNVDALEEAAQDVIDATDGLVDDVRALGRPDTESGQEVEDSLESFADTAEAERDDIEQAIDAVSNFSDLPAAITTIGTSITAMGEAFERTLQAIEDADTGGELETALEQSSACDEITSPNG